MEENVSAFNTIFGIEKLALDVSNHNETLPDGLFFFGSEIYSKSFVLNKSLLIEILHLLTTFQQLTTRSLGVHAHTSRHTCT